MLKWSIIYFLFTFVNLGLAQKDSVAVVYDTAPLEISEITDKDLQTYRQDSDFNYEMIKKEIGWWEDFKTWLGNLLLRFFEWLFGVEKAAGFFANFLRWIPYILLGVLIFILIKFFRNVNARAVLHYKSNEALVALSEEEHIIKNEDIQQLIQQALTNKNYRLAVRYYYLFVLQIMSDKELIAWEFQKTNHDYLNEIKKTELKQLFRTITRWYDYIWYGNFDIDEAKYTRVATDFGKLQKQLQHG